ncbi:MAG: hypothetical protein RL088_291 [Verrucomicrobiota bacterium]|jgi:hypothetical protein
MAITNNQNTMLKTKNTILLAAVSALISSQAFAGTPATPAAPAAKSRVSGTLSLTVDTHFISYGADVWGAGSSWKDPLFHPQLELSVQMSEQFKLIFGTWWDVNDNTTSSIGSSVQEVDLWAGFAYTSGPLTYTLLYQEWMYASDSERIVDFKVAYDTFLKPTLTLHGRVDGNGTQDEGIVGVISGAYDFTAGPVNFSIPGAIAFATDNFHGGDAGFAYASLGLQSSIALKGAFEGTTLSAGVTYYHTEDSVIPGNPDSDFVTGNVGVSFSF